MDNKDYTTPHKTLKIQNKTKVKYDPTTKIYTPFIKDYDTRK